MTNNIIALYLKKHRMTQTDFAASVDVSIGAVHQYINEIRPVSDKVCVRIEKFTQGELNRKNLRPDDWREVWPEIENFQYPNAMKLSE